MNSQLILAGLLSCSLFSLVSCGNKASDSVGKTQPAFKNICSSLIGKSFNEVKITNTTWFDSTEGMSDTAFCKVSATRTPYLDIEIDLPEIWTNRIYQVGGGGFDGSINSGLSLDSNGNLTAVNKAIGDYHAIYVSTNGGNRSDIKSEAAPNIWITGTTEAEQSIKDYAYDSLITGRELADELAQEFYGKKAKYSYFSGCSNGGRAAYNAAARYPDKFSAIIAGCAPIDIAGQTVKWLQIAKAQNKAPLTTAQFKMVYAKALDQCDNIDGIKDGIIANPSDCNLKSEELLCSNNSDSNCLSEEQVETLNQFTTDMRLSNNSVVYSGINFADYSGYAGAFAELGGPYAYLATKNPVWVSNNAAQYFDLNRDFPIIQAGLQEIGMDADINAVAKYVTNGGKIISWHSTSDALISTKNHLRTYKNMLSIAENLGLTNSRNTSRFFLVPAAHHGGASSLMEVDWLKAAIDWVENDTAPIQLVYNFSLNDMNRSLPVCENPMYPHYNGSGDVANSANYSCVMSKSMD